MTGVSVILPVLSESIKGFKKIHRVIKTAKKCTDAISEIELEFKIQQTRFTNECLLLLHLVEDDEDLVTAMVAKPRHESWNDAFLEDQLKEVLSNSYNVCEGIILSCANIQELLATELQCFSAIRSQRIKVSSTNAYTYQLAYFLPKGETLKRTFERVKGAFTFEANQENIEKLLHKLKGRNGDLEALYRQVARMRKRRKQKEETSIVIAAQPLPGYLTQVPQISGELYGALMECFSCGDASHNDHTASLSFNVQHSDTVRMDVVITCLTQCDR
jgi:hypothetical protein